jgi:hypothetical protein
MMMAAEAEQQRPGRQGERLKKAEWLAPEGTTTTPVGFREDAGFVALMMRFSLGFQVCFSTLCRGRTRLPIRRLGVF